MMPGEEVMEIDGSVMEGGGQILRNAVSLSCLTGQKIRIKNIRAGRTNPGLQAQHLMGLRLIREICNGKLSGDEIGSSTVTFLPGKAACGTYSADTKTAGSVCLLLQVALPCICFGKGVSTVLLKGGTDADMAPPVDYFVKIVGPVLAKMGVQFTCKVIRRGFFPRGGGEVSVTVNPVRNGKLLPIVLDDFGEVMQIDGSSFCAGSLPVKVAQIMAREAENVLSSSLPGTPIKIDASKIPDSGAVATGSGIMLVARTTTGCLLASSCVGSKGKPAELVGNEVATCLVTEILNRACVDSNLQDQLILFMALADGKSRMRCGPITLHTKTAIYVAEKLTKAQFTITPCSDTKPGQETYVIECDGIGLTT